MAKGKYEYWITEEGSLKIEGLARDGLTDEQIAHNMGINIATLYAWKKKYSEIYKSLKRGKEVVDILVENALLKRALGYKYTETTKERIVDTGQKKRHGGESELTEREWKFAIKYFNGHCCYCGAIMDVPTKDHIKPLKDGGTMSRDNIIPCCKSCNSSKKDHEMLSWYQKQKFYKKERAQKIYDYIEFVLSLDDLMDEMVITKEITKEVVPDTTAQIFWLKNRKPEQWRDKRVIDDANSNKGADILANMQIITDVLKNPVPNRKIEDLEGDEESEQTGTTE